MKSNGSHRKIFTSLKTIGRGGVRGGSIGSEEGHETGVCDKEYEKRGNDFEEAGESCQGVRDALAELIIRGSSSCCTRFRTSIILYLVMEFMPGGDLMTLLIVKTYLTETRHSSTSPNL